MSRIILKILFERCLSKYEETVLGDFTAGTWMDEQRSFVFSETILTLRPSGPEVQLIFSEESCAEISEPSCCQQFIGDNESANYVITVSKSIMNLS